MSKISIWGDFTVRLLLLLILRIIRFYNIGVIFYGM